VSNESDDFDRDLSGLESELKRLEAEYNMFFAGRLPRPPWETRGRVEAMVKRLDRQRVNNYGARFRFTTIQSRFAAFVDLWDRGLRSREEGRRGPFAQQRPVAGDPKPADRVLHVATINDPTHEPDKLNALFDTLVAARRSVGLPAVPYPDFAALVEKQVTRLKGQGGRSVTFRLAVKDGKIAFTARATKGAPGS
jgi:hypothetical protein